jgi:hypothetical protein
VAYRNDFSENIEDVYSSEVKDDMVINSLGEKVIHSLKHYFPEFYNETVEEERIAREEIYP